MDHAITVRDLVWIGGIVIVIVSALGGLVWLLAQYNTDI